MTFQPTACILCECNCGIEVELEGRTLKRIRGDRQHPASKGYTCNKAMRLDYYQNGKHRLQSPLRRRPDGSFEEIDWDTAIAEIAAGYQRIAAEHGGRSIFYYGGGGQGNHLGGAYSGGERRGYTANTIYRNDAWRKRDADGALRVSAADAQRLGLVDGGAATITTARGTATAQVEVSDGMQAGHASLPNGYGLGDGHGVAPNSLTSGDWRDPVAGTPWHKHVPARITAQ